MERKPSAFVQNIRAPRTAIIGATVLMGAATIAGCTSARMVTSEQSLPPTVQVYQRPPLSLPPIYGQRPKPSAEPSSDASPREAGSKPPAGAQLDAGSLSPGTAALLQAADASEALPNIDRLIMQETTIVTREDPAFVDRLIFGTETYGEGETGRHQIALEQEQDRLIGF